MAQFFRVNAMKELILKACKVGSVSFAELSRKIPGFSGGKQDFGIHDKNIFFWVGMTPEACSAISELLRDGLIKMKPCQPIIYAFDGELLQMPVARQLRSYKEPRWQPVVFNLCGGANK